MSKHAAASTSVSVSSLQQVGLKKPKRKVSKVRLPTPPPDPTVHDEAGPPKNRPAADKDAEFFEYLESLQKSPHQNLTRANSAFAPALATDDAFDHLDKLYKLMKQMLILTEQNSKLHRRVRDLEHLINIQIMQRQLKHVDVVEVPEVDKDTIFAESLLDTILLDTKRDAKPKHPSQFRFRQSILRRQRHRSNSASFDKQPIDMNNLQTLYRRASAMTSPDKKVSKWTKVKAAFKWERASQTVSDVKSQDSGVSGMLPVNCEVARYLRVPSTSEDLGASPADSGAAELSTPGTMSSASSNEEIFFQGRRGIREDTSDDDQSFTLEYIPNSKEESNALQKSSSGKSHRTPWAKMKDIIQTRNSIKKRNRLSAKSDDFRIDESIGSDNEDVFESTNAKNPQFVIHHDYSRTEPFHSNSSDDKFQLPIEIVERYQQIMAEENMYRETDASKWTRVKKAFLSTPSISRPDNSIPSSPISEGHYTMEHNALKSENISKLQEEIQINYRELQNKLSLEFHDKMREWEKIKQSASTNALSNTASGSVSSPDDAKEQAFKKKLEEWEKIKGQTKRNLQLQSEEHLPPEFRKKLQEWQKIKKSKDDASPTASNPKKKLGDWPRWKSISGHRPEAAHLDYQPLSEDFIKKLESWKQMKASASTDDGEASKGYKTPSPKLTRKDGSSSRHSKKGKENPDKENRFERERQKYVDREERLTKLRRSVMGGSKKDILVHTPSGFYRFEGISRKFTQKLYEWEKAQGIGPEASTIALLSTCYVPSVHTATNKRERKRLMKSKSADSFANPELTLNLLNQQPSSLSLNDMEHLETQRLLNMSSVPDIIRSRENVDPDEPEAVIVEVEDIVEETAGPLVPIMRKKHTPVYQKQETFSMCEGETRAAPKVQRSESTRAQTNYNLIEDIIDLLKLVAENESEISHREATQEAQHDSKRTSHYLKNLYHLQEETSGRIIEKFVGLQEANTRVTTSILSEESSYATSRLTDVLDTVQDLSIDLLQLAEKLHDENAHRTGAGRVSNSRQRYPNIFNVLNQQNAKILELRRVLSYLCAASDSTAPTKKKKRNVKGALRKSLSAEKTPKRNSSKKSNIESEDRNDDLSAQIAQGAIKKRYRFRQKGPNDRTLDESDDDDVKTQRRNRQRRLQKAASAPDEVATTKPEEIEANAIQNVVVPTKPNFVTVPDPAPRDSTDSPIQVFVKTTRRLFTPIVTSSFALESRKVEISSSPTVTLVPSFHGDPTMSENQSGEIPEGNEQVSRLPPLPASPISQRKCSKEISPNIRLMMVRYNQKIQEHEAPRSAGSSGSSSPIAWRSPVNERRVKTQTAKYQQDLLKLSLHPIEVQKSASWGVMNPDHKSLNLMKSPDNSTRGILKSCSTSTLTNDMAVKTKRPLKLTIPDPAPRLDPDARTHKLQKAKEEFLSSPVSPISAPPQLAPEGDIKYPERNRLSQISVGSESSYDSAAYDGLLMKSASAGMINIEVEAYNQIDPEIHGGGYVSLPRYNKKRKEGFMSNIASKFRKVKMRRNKESNKMNTISTLCRQSLVVDINKGSQETLTAEASSRKDSLEVPVDSKGSSSGDTSPSTSRSGSWMRPPRLFKPKQ